MKDKGIVRDNGEVIFSATTPTKIALKVRLQGADADWNVKVDDEQQTRVQVGQERTIVMDVNGDLQLIPDPDPTPGAEAHWEAELLS